MKKRDQKGRFLPGISGNPTGRTKKGEIPKQESPVANTREVLEEIEKSATELIERNKYSVLERSLKMAEKNEKLMSLWTEFYLRQEMQKNAKRPQAPRNRRQIELDLQETLSSAGIKVEMPAPGNGGNRFIPVRVPADEPEKTQG